jgi:heme exporter protein C
MAVAFTLYYVAVLLMRMRSDILEREKHTSWVAETFQARAVK